MINDRAKAIRSALLTAYNTHKAGGGDVDLPMDETSREKRAQEQGFDTSRVLYHGTDKTGENEKGIENFIPSKRGRIGPGVYFSPNSKYAERYISNTSDTANVLPVHVRGKIAKISDIDSAFDESRRHLSKNGDQYSTEDWKNLAHEILKNRGFSGKEVSDEVVIFDPKNVRSKFAKFDPKRAHESDIGAATGGFIHDPEKAKRHALMIARGLHKAAGGDVEEDEAPPVYYSALKQGVANAKPMQAPPQDWKAITSKLPGVKQEEIDYSGLHDFLDKQQGQVSKDDVLSHLKQNPAADLREVWKSGLTGPNKTKFGSWVLPGGTNYKELVLALPKRPEDERNYESPDIHTYGDDASDQNRLAHIRMNDRVGPNGEKLLHIEELQSDWHQTGRDKGYTPRDADKLQARRKEIEDIGHAATPDQRQEWVDIMNRLRPDTRDVDSNTTGYRGVPDAPFKDTKDWTALALKRVMRHAADKGYDGITWTTGDQQADRYDLSHHLDRIEHQKEGDQWRVRAFAKDNPKTVMSEPQQIFKSADEISKVFGKDVAKKVVEGEGDQPDGKFSLKHAIRGDGLRVGGSGMRKYYDQIVPSVANKLAKEHGVKHSMIQYPESGKKYRIEQTGTQRGRPAYTAYDEDDNMIDRSTIREDVEDAVKQEKGMSGESLHYLPVTPSMKKSAKLFKSGGPVEGDVVRRALNLTRQSRS